MSGAALLGWLKARIPGDAPISPLIPAAMPAYIIAAAATIALVIAYLASGFTLQTDWPCQPLLLCISLLVPGLVATRHRMGRAGSVLQAMALMGLFSLLAQFGSIFMSAIALPFADQALDNADKEIGFDWVRLTMFMGAHPVILSASEYVYNTIIVQPFIIFGVFILHRDNSRLWVFVMAWAFALLICVAAHPLSPAVGAFVYHGIEHAQVPGLKIGNPWLFGKVIASIRGGERAITTMSFIGLISIPSFHSAAATLFSWAVWRSVWLRYPILLLNIAMSASALVVGGHYLVDIIAGVVLGFFAIVLAKAAIKIIPDHDGGSPEALKHLPME